MPIPISEQRITQVFDIGIAVKGITGLLEVAGGFVLLYLTPAQMLWVTHAMTHAELAEDPRDMVANFVLKAAAGITPHDKFLLVALLLSHGLVKIILVIELFRGRLWAYPLTIVILAAFMVYQTYQMIYSHSLLLAGLTVFDGIIAALAWHEYDLRKRQHASGG